MNDFKIAEYDEFTAKINEIKEVSNFIPDVTTKDGYEKSKRVSLDIGKILTKLDKTRKDQKAHWIEGGKQVDSQAKEIKAILEGIQLPHKNAYKELDNIKKQQEADRKAKLESRVLEIVSLPELMQDSHSSEIAGAIESLQNNECLDFYEFSAQALKARNESKKQLSDLFAKRLQEEKDAKELEELRAKQVLQEQKEREERIAREASEKAESEKLEAIKREAHAKQAAIDAENARIAQEKQAKIDAENAKIEAEKQAKQAAENARLAEIARQEAEEKRKADELAKLEANKKHVGEICKQSKEDLMQLGLSEEQAKKVVKAIAKKEIRNISIQY